MLAYVVASVCWSFVYFLVGVGLGLVVREMLDQYGPIRYPVRRNRRDDHT